MSFRNTSRFTRPVSKKAGDPPGTLVHVGEREVDEVSLTVIDYDEQNLEERDFETVEIKESYPYKDEPTVTWINVEGLHNVDLIEEIGENFGFHPLILEDILNTEQRPKIEIFDDHIFIVLKMLYYDSDEESIVSEQVSIILGDNFVFSFQESGKDVFDPVRERIRKSRGRIRSRGSDYLAYALIDAVVDHYFVILELIDDKLEILEEELIDNPSPEILQTLHNLKREMVYLRKSIWPLREIINTLEREETSLIDESTDIYLRDLYDHTIQVIDSVESFRDVISGMMDVYLSSVSNRMNEVMKVLTIIATIFIPLTFIAGIYGMNFEFMPELGWRYSYPLLLLMMGLVAIGMLYYFRRRGWL